MGRRTLFKQKLADFILELAAQGLTDKEIAEKCGIACSTLYLWKNKHKNFSEAVQASKDAASDLVEAALFRRAIGYSHPETKVIVSEAVGVVTEEVTKHYPPDTKAAEFWLKNRRPKKWREQSEVKHTGLEELIMKSKQEPSEEDEEDGAGKD